jgi:hypothetical protein
MGGRHKKEGRRTKCERLHDEKIANTSTIAMPSVPSPVQYSTVQYSTVQYSTVQYSTAQYLVSQGRSSGPGCSFL